MPADPLAELEAVLGAPPPPGLVVVAPEDLAAVAAAVRAARHHERRALREALDAALALVPTPLRAVVRRMVAG